MSIEIYLSNLGKHTEGRLEGTWVNLPVPIDKLDKVLAEIGIDERYEEYFITDCETSFSGMREAIGEFTSLAALNELAEMVDGLSKDREEVFAAVMETESCGSIEEIKEIIEQLDDFDLLQGVDDDAALGAVYADEYGCIDIPDHLRNYFDYAAFGRDIRMDSNITYTTFGCLVDNR